MDIFACLCFILYIPFVNAKVVVLVSGYLQVLYGLCDFDVQGVHEHFVNMSEDEEGEIRVDLKI